MLCPLGREEKIVMAHALSLAMRLFIVVFAMGYRIVEGTINFTTVSDQGTLLSTARSSLSSAKSIRLTQETNGPGNM